MRRKLIMLGVLICLGIGGDRVNAAGLQPRGGRRICCHGLLGDVNRDGWVNALDFSIINVAYGAAEGDPRYSRRADLTCDGRVDADDVAVLRLQYWKRVSLDSYAADM